MVDAAQEGPVAGRAGRGGGQWVSERRERRVHVRAAAGSKPALQVQG